MADLVATFDRITDRVRGWFSRRIGPERERPWSPYGHEKARHDLIVTRQIQVVFIAIGIAMVYGVTLELTKTEQADFQTSLDIQKPGDVKPITVTVTPGGTPAFANPQAEAPEANPNLPKPEYKTPMDVPDGVKRLIAMVGPLALAFWALGRMGASSRSKLAELNLGVYKGAMPYEMHAAGKSRDRVFTQRQVDANVFGKERTDYLFGTYLHEPPMSVKRFLGDPDTQVASVRRLKKGSAARAPLVAAGAAGAPAAPLRRVTTARRVDAGRAPPALRDGTSA